MSVRSASKEGVSRKAAKALRTLFSKSENTQSLLSKQFYPTGKGLRLTNFRNPRFSLDGSLGEVAAGGAWYVVG